MSGSMRVTNHDYEWHPKYYGVLVGLFCGLYMITSALVAKMVDIGGFIFSAAIITFPLCCIITDLLTEVYGFNRTRQAIWTVLACSVMFALFSKIAIALPAAAFWPHQDAYVLIFDAMPRIVLAGCSAWLAGEFLNSFVMSRMKIFQNAKNPAARFIGSTVVGQLADSLVFYTIAFAGTMPAAALVNMILVAWGAKIAYEVVALPLSVPIAARIKRLEGIEHFDRQKLSLV